MLKFENNYTKVFLTFGICCCSLLLLGGFGLLHQVDLLFNFDFSLSLQLAAVITSLFGDGDYFTIYDSALAVAVLHAELREAPLASEIAKGALKSGEGWLFILNFILILGRNFEHVDSSLIRCAAYIFIIGVDRDVGDHCLHGASPQLDQGLLRVGVEQPDQGALLGCSRQDRAVLREAQHGDGRIMGLYWSLALVIILLVKQYDLNFTRLLHRERQDAVLKRWKGNETEWVLER